MCGFVVSQRVRVKTENPGPNQRVPAYARGRLGVVFRVHGSVPNYSHDHAEDWGPLYSVRFASTRAPDGRSNEKVIVDIHESWLAEAPPLVRDGFEPRDEDMRTILLPFPF